MRRFLLWGVTLPVVFKVIASLTHALGVWTLIIISSPLSTFVIEVARGIMSKCAGSTSFAFEKSRLHLVAGWRKNSPCSLAPAPPPSTASRPIPSKSRSIVGYGDTLVVIVGLPDAAVKESRDRVSTALTNSGYKFPMGKTTINLAPADVKKEGPSFDLPIAIGMLAASEQIETDQLDNFVIVGELALTGGVRSAKAFCPSRCERKRTAKPGCWCRRKCRRSRRGRRLECDSGAKSPRGRAVSGRRNQNLADDAWTSQKSSHTNSTTKMISPKSKARKTSSAPWKSPAAVGHNVLLVGPRERANPCWRNGSRPFCRRSRWTRRWRQRRFTASSVC